MFEPASGRDSVMEIRSWLYVPGDRPDRFDSAMGSGADAVVIDLEDAVAPSRKESARQVVTEWLRQPRVGPRIVIRINAISSDGMVDVSQVIAPSVFAVRMPKVEDPKDVIAVAEFLEAQGSPAVILPILETCRGVERATEIATAHSRVAGLQLGEVDFVSDLGTDDPTALDWVRLRVIVAARAAHLPNPPQGVYQRVRDLEGLKLDCEHGRSLGFYGRSAIHPSQVRVIHSVCAPTGDEIIEAESLLDGITDAHRRGIGGYVDSQGRFVDAAAVARAQLTMSRVKHVETRIKNSGGAA